MEVLIFLIILFIVGFALTFWGYWLYLVYMKFTGRWEELQEKERQESRR